MLLNPGHGDKGMTPFVYQISRYTEKKDCDLLVTLWLFKEDRKSAAMIKHGMDVMKGAYIAIK